MRDKSVFCVECPCGQYIESHERETTCPACKRVIVFIWGDEPEPKQQKEEPKQ